jgi:hypothetical protein
MTALLPPGLFKSRALRTGLLLAAGLTTWLAATAVSAHFLLNLNVRVLHVEHLADGLRVYLRTPMPYLVADRIGPVGADGLPEPAPYTTNGLEKGKLVHRVDPDALRSDSVGLGRLAANGFRIDTDGGALRAAVEQVRASPIGAQPPFATLEEARRAFGDRAIYPDDAEPAYVGDVVVDMILRYRTDTPVYRYSVMSILDPGLPGQNDTANLILDYSPGATRVFRARGLLTEPVIVSRSAWSAMVTFIREGVRHILEGWDHVLFVLCLTLGATRLGSLVWRATGFTIGHSVTLMVGFFGYVPSGAWFIPAVETGIALSIIYAAVIAMMARRDRRRREVEMFGITMAIGLLHGFGFSFVLHKLLQVDSPDIWHSLLAFNVGVEIGQLLLIIIAWPIFRFIARTSDRAWTMGRWGIATSCAAVALVWTAQRAAQVVATI